ncbi:hypothetical protein OG285_32365 [Streptomyces sp. NBC_01471]
MSQNRAPPERRVDRTPFQRPLQKQDGKQQQYMQMGPTESPGPFDFYGRL